MLAIYKHLWQVNWAEQWQYRANLIMYLFYWLVSPIVYLAVWTTVATAQGSVNGLTAQDFVAYYMVLLIVNIATSEITIHILGYRIMDGTLSNLLVLPVHPVLTQVLVNNLAFKALQLIALAPIWAVLYVLFQPVLTITLVNVLLAIPALALGFLFSFFIGATITFIAFWTTRVWAIAEFYFAVFQLFAGQFVPLSLLPPVLHNIAEALPFRLVLYFPVQLILGKLTVQESMLNLGLLAVWCVAGYALFSVVWRGGVKKFSAVGA
ncbi:MAG: ABC-2 family transporter protein [Chloroflexi bacterium]|nr:ABC-2 family transporter protein [Chloroflexota bacterium]